MIAVSLVIKGQTLQERIAEKIALGEQLGDKGQNQQAYQVLLEAKYLAEKEKLSSIELQIQLERNLGEYARRLSGPHRAKAHYLKAIALVMSQPKPDHYQLYQTYMSLGILSWYATKLDSAIYYYQQSSAAVRQIDPSPINTYYRPALIYNNIAGVYNYQGKNALAIQAMDSCVWLLQTYISTTTDPQERLRARTLLMEAYDNLGGAYKELGHYMKTKQLLTHSYKLKQQYLEKDDPALAISQILLAQLYKAISDTEQALHYAQKGVQQLKDLDGDYLFWQGDAYYTLALIYEEQKQFELAQVYYLQADSLYQLAFDGSFDPTYLEFSQHYADFLLQSGNANQAFTRARQTLHYVLQSGDHAGLLTFYQYYHISLLYFKHQKWDQAQFWLKEGNKKLDQLLAQQGHFMDAIKLSAEKSKAMLLEVRLQYATAENPSGTQLKKMIEVLEVAREMLDKKKRILTEPQDLRVYMTESQELADFIEQLYIQYYEKTQDPLALEASLGVHEQQLYARLRSRLDQYNGPIAHVPQEVLQEERQKKAAIIQGEMDQYAHALLEWHQFLERLESDYPSYYALRYADKKKSLSKIAEQLPEDVTLLRYVFVKEKAYVYVIHREAQNFIPLPSADYVHLVRQLRDFSQEEGVLAASHQLYQKLFAPALPYIKGKRVTIIPDGVLHLVSFDLLTSKPAGHFADLSEQALIHDFAISYQYSAYAMGAAPMLEDQMHANYIAFTPVFSEVGKRKYLQSKVADTLDTDYLHLLPLPFTAQLAIHQRKRWGGTLFQHEASTVENFKNHSSHHRIVHIGTHAEANDLFPEYSRLIFIKNAQQDSDNSLYLHELYGIALESHLAVLTACESAVPGHLEGEGMISLAHAFQYAGSRSILAGLWKIDEQSSAQITAHFYAYIQRGLPKDVALQKAKLDYLQQAPSRMIHPEYWAGLALMGELDPIPLETSFEGWWFLGFILLLSVLLVITFYFSSRFRTEK
jgi:CHAT domain-containing protein